MFIAIVSFASISIRRTEQRQNRWLASFAIIRPHSFTPVISFPPYIRQQVCIIMIHVERNNRYISNQHNGIGVRNKLLPWYTHQTNNDQTHLISRLSRSCITKSKHTLTHSHTLHNKHENKHAPMPRTCCIGPTWKIWNGLQLIQIIIQRCGYGHKRGTQMDEA